MTEPHAKAATFPPFVSATMRQVRQTRFSMQLSKKHWLNKDLPRNTDD